MRAEELLKKVVAGISEAAPPRRKVTDAQREAIQKAGTRQLLAEVERRTGAKRKRIVKAAEGDEYHNNDVSPDLVGPPYQRLMTMMGEMMLGAFDGMPDEVTDPAHKTELVRRFLALRVGLRVVDARVAEFMKDKMGISSLDEESFTRVVNSYVEELRPAAEVAPGPPPSRKDAKGQVRLA